MRYENSTAQIWLGTGEPEYETIIRKLKKVESGFYR